MHEHKPPLLVVWGKYDPSFAVGGATAYQRDVPSAEVHILDAGHFALDEKVGEIATLIRTFLEKNLWRNERAGANHSSPDVRCE